MLLSAYSSISDNRSLYSREHRPSRPRPHPHSPPLPEPDAGKEGGEAK